MSTASELFGFKRMQIQWVKYYFLIIKKQFHTFFSFDSLFFFKYKVVLILKSMKKKTSFYSFNVPPAF